MNGYDKLSMDITMVLCMGKVYGTDCMGKLYIKFLCENVNMYLQFVCVCAYMYDIEVRYVWEYECRYIVCVCL